MDRTQKAEAVKSLNELLSDAGAVIVAHYSGMTVAQMGDLRSRLRKAGASFKVAKNRLAVRALEGTNAAGISDLFKGPTGIAYSADPVAAPKVLVAYAKENAKFKILGGVAVGSVLDPEGVKALAELPSLDQLRGKILGLLQDAAAKNDPKAALTALAAAYSQQKGVLLQLKQILAAYTKDQEALELAQNVQALADRQAVVLVAMDDQHRRADPVDEMVR